MPCPHCMSTTTREGCVRTECWGLAATLIRWYTCDGSTLAERRRADALTPLPVYQHACAGSAHPARLADFSLPGLHANLQCAQRHTLQSPDLSPRPHPPGGPVAPALHAQPT